MSRRAAVLCCALLAVPCALRAGPVAYDEPGPREVRTLEFPDLKDAERKDRKVPLKVHFPAEGKGYPLVVLSHGGGGNWDSYVYLAKHLVSHGYVVICPEHVYSSSSRLRYYMRRERMRYMKALYRTTHDPLAMLGRPGDVSFAIDKAVEWNGSHKELKGRIDAGRVGVMGHSYGAYTTLVVCGARPILDHMKPKVGKGKGLSEDFSDPRVIFGLAMSPQPTGGTFFGEDSFKTIDRPLVGISGSKDRWKTAGDEVMPAEKRREFWELLPPGDKYFLWLENADHISFADSPRAWVLPSESRKDVQRITRAMMVLFSDHFLKGKKEAKLSMHQGYADSLLGDVVTSIEWREK